MTKKFGPLMIVEYCLLFLLAALFIFPMLWMVVSSMKPEADVYQNLASFKAFLPSLNPANWFNRIRQKSPILYRWVMNAVRYEGYRW
ncbi:hypothetical protein N8C50_14675 (plasmid) [Enterococcus faecium]